MPSPRNSVEKYSFKSYRGQSADSLRLTFDTKIRRFPIKLEGQATGHLHARLTRDGTRPACYLSRFLPPLSMGSAQMISAEALGFLRRIEPPRGTRH